MGILNIQQILTCLKANSTIKDYSEYQLDLNQPQQKIEQNQTLAPPIDLQTRLKIGITASTSDNQTGYYDGY